MPETSIQNFKNIKEASNAAADLIIQLAESAITEKGFFTLVLAGGQTPQQTYELLTEPARAEKMEWQQVHFFWGDERWLSSTHSDSNFSMAHKALFSRVHIPESNIHRISTGHQDPETGAEMYEKHLRNFFLSNQLTEDGRAPENITFPNFDLVLLGMGTDGHTASLFPNSDLLEEQVKWVAAVTDDIGTPPIPRITLTLPVLNQAENVIFIISGEKKRVLLDSFLHSQNGSGSEYPAALINPRQKLIWIVSENGR